MSAPLLELQEIQATVLRPRPAPYFGTHVLLRVDDAPAGRKFLRRLTPHIASAANWWDAANAWLAIGISYAGVRHHRKKFGGANKCGENNSSQRQPKRAELLPLDIPGLATLAEGS